MSEPDPIQTLLKAGGRRPVVPADRSERVRDAVRARWQLLLAERTRRRRIGWVVSVASAAAVLAAVGLGLDRFRTPVAPEPSGVRVERVTNVAQLPLGWTVPRGGAVVTGPDGRVALRAPSGHSLRLDVGTTLHVLAGAAFVLERGAVYVDSGPGQTTPGTFVRIDTPFGSVEDRGTQFEARLDAGSLTLRVREGVVSVSRPAQRLVADAGQSMRLDAAGIVERTDDAGTAASWSWVEAIAPTMEIEGRSLLDFLNWSARERGVRLRFEDDRLAEKAPKIVLKGSIAGMTLEQALTSVLPTCGMTYRWEPGALDVVTLDPSRSR
jgi:ferric-dicitrate binding protein FerR (iron transport regulator)